MESFFVGGIFRPENFFKSEAEPNVEIRVEIAPNLGVLGCVNDNSYSRNLP